MSDNKTFDHEFFRTTGVQDFKIQENLIAPKGYPEKPVTDEYSKTPFAGTYTERRAAFISHVLKNPSVGTVKSLFYELIRMNEKSEYLHYGKLFGSLEYINQRKDCADFVLSGILRMLYQLADSEMMTEELLIDSKKTVLDFKYWPDEPGTDSMCYWTENHHILFSVNEYLAGKLYPNEVFTNSGMTGLEKMKKAEPRIQKWLELRFASGFIEWLSNVYYDEDLVALLNLVDFSDNQELETRGKMVTDLLIYDMALNSYYGQFVSTHGRTYTKEKQSALAESTIDTSKLLFGMGCFANKDNMSAAVLALSEKYLMPEVLYDIANDMEQPEMINRQRCSIRFEDAQKWGYGKKDLTSAMGLLSAGGYSHPRTINHMVRMLDAYRWWENKFFLEFLPFKKIISIGKYFGLTNLFALVCRKDLSRNAMTEANIYTYRTPDYMLSTAQDYRKGYGGDQHHIWQASLDINAICFTTHPGGYKDTAPDAYWHGSGYLPRAVQHRNVAVIQYNTPKSPRVIMSKLLPFTHAWLPKEAFDEVKQESGWIFAKKGRGYLALYSKVPVRWQEEGENAGKEIIADGLKNTWICELGREEKNGSFNDFITSITLADVKINGLNGKYVSPSVGEISFGWNRTPRCNGEKIQIREYPRYENPYGETAYGSEEINIESDNNSLQMNFRDSTRNTTR